MTTEKSQHRAPMVSIGMPVYNGEKYLRETIDSLLQQTYTDFELIISDNCSTDQTESICREYAGRDERIRYIRQEQNQGAVFNFGFVFTQAIGTYFIWAAADDFFPDADTLQHLVEVAQTGYDYVFPDIDILHQETGKLEKNVMRHFQKVAEKHGYARASLTINSYQIYSLFRTDVLRCFYPFLEECQGMSCFNEGLFVHVISTRAKGCYVPQARRIYRRHKSNMSSSIPASKLLNDFLLYSQKTLLFFLREPSLSLEQRLLLASITLWNTFTYMMYLIAASAKQSIIKPGK